MIFIPTVGQSGSKLWFLAATAYLLYILSILGFLMEVVQLVERKWKYFEDSDNYFQLALYISTVIFIRGFDNECWCSNTWQWQIGALAVFLSWFNFIFILKYMSYTAIPINMFLRVCVKFLKMIFLPIVLILAFGVPHYMVFVRTKVSCQCMYSDRLLTAGHSPALIHCSFQIEFVLCSYICTYIIICIMEVPASGKCSAMKC